MYHFGEIQMRVVKAISIVDDNKSLLKNSRLLVLEHILPTTEAFLRILQEAGCEISCIVAKPYSVDENVLKRLTDDGFNIEKISSYAEIEETERLDQLLMQAIDESKKDKKRVAIIDVGGYFSEPLSRISENDQKYIAGVVEDTTFGHNRYVNKLSQPAGLFCPVMSVARSELKEIEARFVGRDVVQATDVMLRELGISITGRNALVIGYGMIGKNIARTLRGYDLNVYVYDIKDRQLIRAYVDGFHIHKKYKLLERADIIFSATGSEAFPGDKKYAMDFSEIEDCKHGVVLVSAGSKDTEFDIQSIMRGAENSEDLSSHLKKYTLPNSKDVIVANHGTAVNFILQSIPVEILDIVFSEILKSLLAILEGKVIDKDVINRSEQDVLDWISKQWLRSVNM